MTLRLLMARRGRLPRRSVITAARLTEGKRLKLWAFGYADLAALLGTTEGAVRQMVARGRFDPTNLSEVCEAWERRRLSPEAGKRGLARVDGGKVG